MSEAIFPEVFSRLLHRPAESHKYDYGHVLIIGGAPGMVGAPLLSGMAALRTGAGLVTLASEAGVADKLERRVKEIMTLALPSDGAQAAMKLEGFMTDRKVSVIVIGPGLAATDENRVLVGRLLDGVALPLIIDGGGLAALRDHPERLDGAASRAVILTPHGGEFRKLSGRERPAGRADQKTIAANFAKGHGVTLVLKGHPTYVAQSDGPVYENETGNPGLATAGTGDVLAGVIAAIIAQGIEPGAAAEAAVYLHGLAGDLAAGQKTEPGMIAGDVIEAIPAALKRISRDLGRP